jgi:hypothetical protein
MLTEIKQTKITNKISEALKHGNDGQLGTKNNDECYTDANDILRELSQWAALDKFRGKDIICPCDWDIIQDKVTGEYGVLEYKGKRYSNVYGIRIEYDTDKFGVVGNSLYKCIKTIEFMGEVYTLEPTQEATIKVEIAEEDIESFLKTKLTCNFILVLAQQARRWGIKSITASGYNPANKKGTPFQEIDYSKYDICITNPPFSLYSDFMKCIVGKVDFIILAPHMNRALIATIVPLMEQTAFLGFGIHLALKFNNPTKTNLNHIKSVACDWIVSFPEAQQERNNKHFKTGIKYELYKDEYVEMIHMTMKDGTHPIRVATAAYPDDYTGWMFAPISILDNLDQDAYEWYSTNCYKYFNQDHPEKSPLAHNFNANMYVCPDGGKAFSGILLRKKTEEVI